MGIAESAICSLCGLEEESSIHFLCECDALACTRLAVLELAQVSPQQISMVPPALLLRFIVASGRFLADP